jgi:hypothetical protein
MDTEGREKKRKLNILMYFPDVIIDNLEIATKSGVRISIFPETSRMSSRTESKYAVSFC